MKTAVSILFSAALLLTAPAMAGSEGEHLGHPVMKASHTGYTHPVAGGFGSSLSLDKRSIGSTVTDPARNASSGK